MSEDAYIHEPDVKDDDPSKNGLICFMNIDRECGADCMAYVEGNRQQENCMLLVSVDKLTQRVGALAKFIGDAVKDQQRKGPAPPDPLGRRV